jgi:membrane protein YdbS with pleckstrin-like domain
MTDLTYTWDQPLIAPQAAPRGIPWFEPAPRSIWQPILLIVPVLFAVSGYFFQSPMLTDVSFVFLALFCTLFLIADLSRFSERYGLGGIVLFGGVLVWFCYDYFYHWFLDWFPSWSGELPAEVIAKSAVCHMMYILCMTIGLRIHAGRWFPRLMTRLPEPANVSTYFWIVLLTQVIGLSPYFIFTHEHFYMAIYHQITAGRSGLGTEWTVGRTGNVNYSWGAYVAQMLQIGDGGAVLASFCIIFLRQGPFRNTICGCVWLLWLALGFGTGTRGEMVILLLPLVCFIFIRYHVHAQELLKRYSARAYVAGLIVLILAVGIVQIQGRFRNMGYRNINLSRVSFFNLQGNSMFSEGLMGFAAVPQHHDYFYNRYPGEMMLLPIPNLLFWAAVAPVPRALWTSKPIDHSWEWYNAIYTGQTATNTATAGTTISQGIVGYWFFRFGIFGVIEGGLFMGWLLGCAERALLNNRGRPMAVLASLGLLSWLFRAFRDIGLQDLTQVLVALGGIVLCVLIFLPFGRRPAETWAGPYS